ncbi:hypothetical protein H0E87_027160 [Populus deltoides]|uniref:Uncharacterized protein n=1 Tax=Populus deltoides TaxID=3696 RepID=A0A8T2WZP9_POPDE|nr:hypothetical protein H0E87_027160 [Populus deltoides]
MTRFGGSFTHIVMAMVVVALLRICGVMAQDISPTPAMDTGAGLELPLSMAVISSSMIFSVLALMYVLIAEFHGVWYRTSHIGEALVMAKKNTNREMSNFRPRESEISNSATAPPLNDRESSNLHA